jgi:transmembrane sensor
MSDTSHRYSASPSAKDVDEVAADWLQRRHFWNWSEEDEAALETWLASSPAHRVAYLRLDAAWGRAERLAALRHAVQEETSPIPRERNRPGLKIASALVVAAAFGVGAALLLSHGREQTYATQVGGHETVTLADGSQVELNTDTVLRADMSGDQKTIWLDRGEAYFQVKHDVAHPFVVMAGKQRVTDLGTKFVVRRDIKQFEVAVVEGRVRFDTLDSRAPQPAMLIPGDVVVATLDSMSVTRKPARELTSELGWRRGVLVFEHATLADAAAEFNRYNSEKLVIADAAAGRRTIGATLRTNDVELFAHAAQELLGLRVEKRSGEIVISR